MKTDTHINNPTLIIIIHTFFKTTLVIDIQRWLDPRNATLSHSEGGS